MSFSNTLDNLKAYHRKLNGNTVSHDLTSYQQLTDSIKNYRKTLINKTDSQLKQISEEFKSEIYKKDIDELIMIQAYGLVIEVIWRVMQIVPYDVQMIGAIALHHGKLIEMQTGEGKTLMAVFPAFLNALTQKGVHILTFNDYLAQRDAQWMEPVYTFLDISVGYIQEGMSIKERQNAYNSDITYMTAKECGFDYLRDSLCYCVNDRVHKEFHYAIIDEADSILIDESRVPLIISDTIDSTVSNKQILLMTNIANQLTRPVDFDFDQYARNIYLTENGVTKAEQLLQCNNLYDEENTKKLAQLHHALHAEYLLHIDKDYIVRNGTIEIVDELTGRVAENRRWPDGLHAAVEAKENCLKECNGRILNSICLQHFLSHYPRISGMTATAQVAEEEFRNFYNLHIVVLPPNRPCCRKDFPDQLFVSKHEKNLAIIEEICTIHNKSRPVLVGTQSVDESAKLADSLNNSGIRCQILNAKNDEQEAKVIALAGKQNMVTISTNMAGRGTDIHLGADNELEKNLIMNEGGLHVIGTNRYESRRIDNQLRGRCARQGDPGSSRFFMSLEDDLFVKYRLKELFSQVVEKKIKNRRIIDDKTVMKEIDRVQRIIEGQNLEIKITLFKYTILLEQQRKIISEKRNAVLESDEFMCFFKSNSPDIYNALQRACKYTQIVELCRKLYLIQIDTHWSEYLSAINDLREGIHLRRFSGQNPLFEFRKISLEFFDDFLLQIDQKSLNIFNTFTATNGSLTIAGSDLKAPSATWTYIVNDDPFENHLLLELGTNVGMSLGTIIAWPLLLVVMIVKKFRPHPFVPSP